MKKVISSFLAAFMILGFVGCSNQKPVEKSKANVQSEQKKSHYPVKIKTYNFARKPIEVTFNKSPEKVLAVCQNSVETLMALGLQDKIVAAAELDHDIKDKYKHSLKRIKYYEEAPSKEEVIAIQPDFILGWYFLFSDKMLGDVGFWNSRGINTYMAKNSGVILQNSLQNEYDDILNIGKIFNVEDKANAIVNNMKKEIEKSKEFVKGKKPVKTVILEVGKDKMYRIYGKESIGGDVATQVGADLVGKKNASISAEELVKLNPDVIFTVHYGKELSKDVAVNSILNSSALASISAVKSKRVNPIMLGEVYASGVRTLDGIKTISKGLYPELYKNKAK
ncbi:ABC transporter substrate-binding protein [Clostridium botulinum]|uniref:ABC transporter substrate-binding protein n=1 Tax=Clostridium botulinum TaxID=1491 RepID=UPI0004D41C49|nr:ABC transporter substrate-binding protein [Clostridium botulinum]KEI00859.1 iron ABC transporter substrate-binding protein [Clostridium botulinum C/D str. BKT75002]KEI09173.1 iron ABC transporter substrate-binding protein [Clostridium botulinum C/D str. BKT2873]QPW61432.1 ABC transporter substrate-binding protein [Clostridium botulinum]